jgi:chromosomal replication initiator protein
MDAERTWEAALGQLQMELPRATFDTWVRDAELLAYEDGTFVLG